MITNIIDFKQLLISENVNVITNHEKWGNNFKIILRNENSPNQNLIGTLDYNIINNTEFYIESIAVQPFYRKEGYAKQLFNNLLNIAKTNNIQTIRLHAYSIDKTKITTDQLVNIYKSWGFIIHPDNDDQMKIEMIYYIK